MLSWRRVVEVSDSRQQRLLELFGQLLELRCDDSSDAEALAELIEERQGIIDQISEIDGSLALIQQTVSESRQLSDMLGEIADLDQRLFERAEFLREGLHSALSKTGRGRRAARGYRLMLPRSAAIIDRQL